MAQHAYLSASSAYRWLVCPPLVSVEANSGIQERYSPYAAEGTEAHTLGELKLRQFLGEDVTGQINTFKGTAEFYDDEMDKHTDTYVDRVIEEFNQHPGAQLELEVKVDFSHWVPKGFGTSDAVIISDGLVEVIDLKYGKGVPVSAYQNPQLMLYALGAFARYDFIYDFEQVKMTIIQPRLDNFSTFTLDVPELLYWADNYVAPRAAEAYEGRGEWTIDKDVMRFSKVRGNLRPRAQLNFKLIDDYIETEPALLGNSEIGKILERSDEIESWLKDVQAYALNQILQKGEKVDGYKVVEGRSNRKIKDEEAFAERLKEEGYADEQIFKPRSLETITNLTKLTGKKGFEKLSEGYVYRPAGKPKLVKENDKRPAIGSVESAREDFSDD